MYYNKKHGMTLYITPTIDNIWLYLSIFPSR